jgi:hypothetical protein
VSLNCEGVSQETMRILRKICNRYTHLRTYVFRWHKVRQAVRESAPLTVGSGGPAEVHMLCSHRSIWEGIAALKSFYRFGQSRYPLVFHGDGSLRRRDIELIETHLPGVRVVPRKEADARVEGHLVERGLESCLRLRRAQKYQLKLFDFAVYADGKPFLQMDSDVLFLRPPHEVFAALEVPAAQWVDRYNVDCGTYYTWSAEEVKRRLNVELIPQINVGLMCLKRDVSCFEFYEHCLKAMPVEGARTYFYEQTLTALESSRRGAQALPAAYDVADRLESTGAQVISQHYCSKYRPRFYDDFCERVAPALSVSGRSGVQDG